MSQLQALLPQLRARIAQGHGKRTLNEQNTKASLIDPVLRALGWDTEDVYEVAREFKPRRADKPVDYALLSQRTPRLFIEAKALGQNLDDRKWAGQIMGYAGVAGVEWVVLTDGDEWRIYNAHAAVAVDEKLFRTVRISADGTLAQETLALLAKAQWDGKRIEVLWQLQFVDRRVRVAIDGMFGSEPDAGLVRLIHKRFPGLGGKDIRASLSRAHFSLEFPTPFPSADPPPPPPRPSPSSGISLLDLVNAGILKTPLALERTYKGHVLTATVNAEGCVVYKDVPYESLSTAAGMARQSVLGCAKPPSCNGWKFWRFLDHNGNLIHVDTIRQQYLEARK